MLRVSAQTTGTEVNLAAINGGDVDAGIPLGPALARFAESVARRDEAELAASREALREAGGDAVLVDAAGVAANFQRMVRIADSIGIPVDDMTSELGRGVRAELGIERFASARNTLGEER